MIQVAPENSVSIDSPHSRHRAGRRRPPPLSVPQLLGSTRSQVSSAPGPPQNSAFISFLDLARRGPLRKTQLLSAFWTLLVSARSPKLSFYQLFGSCSSRPAPQNSALISFLDLARLGLLPKTPYSPPTHPKTQLLSMFRRPSSPKPRATQCLSMLQPGPLYLHPFLLLSETSVLSETSRGLGPTNAFDQLGRRSITGFHRNLGQVIEPGLLSAEGAS